MTIEELRRRPPYDPLRRRAQAAAVPTAQDSSAKEFHNTIYCGDACGAPSVDTIP